MSTVVQILTYDGSETDIILNYLTFFVNTLVLAAVCRSSATSTSSRYDENTSRNLPRKISLSRNRTWLWVTSLLFLFQIFLCSVLVRCVGISVVWSAQCSFSVVTLHFYQIYNDNRILSAAVFTSTCLSVTLWIYYIVVSDLITTVAHFCSILLGLVLYALNTKMCTDGMPQQQEEENALFQ